MKVTMIVGPPASGKSSLRDSLTTANTVVLNRDTEGGKVLSLLPKLEEAIKNGKDVILDNLYATAESRKPFIDLCKSHGVDISCQVMGASIEDAQFNVVNRAFDLIGEFPSPEAIKKANHTNVFPPVVLFKYKKEYEKPSTSEGFSSVKIVPFKRRKDPTLVNKALILDYDGTLRECVGGNGKYPTSTEQIKILPGRLEVLQKYKDQGYRLLGVSNQSGVAKGDLTLEKTSELFEYTNKLLGIDIEYHFCPHRSAPLSCYCRKPGVGFGVLLIRKYKLNPSECIMVGDYTSDRTFSKRCGFQYIDQADFFK